MALSGTRLGEYIGSGESLRRTYTATLTDRSTRKTVTLGMTERRLFYVSEDGWFGAVSYDSITGIESRPQTRRTYCFDDYRLVLGAGGLAVVLGLASVVAFATTAAVPFLLLTAVCGLATAEYVRMQADETDWDRSVSLRERIERLDIERAVREFRAERVGRVDAYQLLLLGSGLLGVASLAGIAVLATNYYVVLGAVLLVGGLGVLEYASRHRAEFEGFEVVRHRERAVHINTEDDRTLTLRVDASSDLCEALSRARWRKRREPDPAMR